MTKMIEIKDASKRWGIVVGVDKYANAGEHLHNLRGCVADADKMCKAMIDKKCCGFAEKHVVMLENPTYTEIESAFVDVGGKMKRGDELWFYYAGHGYSERRGNGVSGYLLPSDVNWIKNGKPSTHGCISHNDLRDKLIARNIPHGNITIVLFLDCCCAGSVGLADGSRAASADVQEMSDGFTKSFRDLSLQSPAECENWDFKYISFMATGTSGKAREDASGGEFTRYLIEGLHGGRPDYPTVGPDPSDIYIRAGELGNFLGHYVSGQEPRQDFTDTRYPLSMSSERRLLLAQMQQMDKQVIGWLHKMREESLLDADTCGIADGIFTKPESRDFKFAGMMRNLMRLFSDPASKLPIGLKEGAELIKAFCEMKKLLEGKDAPDTKVPQQKDPPRPCPVRPTGAPSGTDRLSARDRELLADVADRLGRDDLKSVATQQEAVAALNEVARKWVRNACRKGYHRLYLPNERAKWSNQEGKGFDTLVESAVRELVLDDEALDKALAGRKR